MNPILGRDEYSDMTAGPAMEPSALQEFIGIDNMTI